MAVPQSPSRVASNFVKDLSTQEFRTEEHACVEMTTRQKTLNDQCPNATNLAQGMILRNAVDGSDLISMKFQSSLSNHIKVSQFKNQFSVRNAKNVLILHSTNDIKAR